MQTKEEQSHGPLQSDAAFLHVLATSRVPSIGDLERYRSHDLLLAEPCKVVREFQLGGDLGEREYDPLHPLSTQEASDYSLHLGRCEMPRLEQTLLSLEELLGPCFYDFAKRIELCMRPQMSFAICRIKVRVCGPPWEIQQRFGRSKAVPVKREIELLP